MDQFGKIKKDFFENQNQETYDNMVQAFRDLVNNKIWVRFPVRNNGDKPIHATVIHNDREYIVMFSCDEKIQLDNDMSLAMTDINKGIETIYENPHCAGLVIDPFTEDALYLPLPKLEWMSGLPNPRNQKIDWGKGIPNYSENDLMVEEELLDFGIEVVSEYLKNEKYEILETTNSLLQPSNIIARKENEICSITIKTAIMDIRTSLSGMDKKPELSLDEMEAALKFSKKFNTVPYYAPVGIGSTDAERMMKGLALIGDGFYVNFSGIERL